MASAIPAAIGGVADIFSGFGASKGQKSSSSFNQSSDQEANLDAKQKKTNKSIFQQLLQYIRRGPTVQQSDRDTARSQINRDFNAANENIAANLSASGFGNSGKMGAGIRSTNLERQKAFQGAESSLRSQSWQRFMQMLGMGMSFDTPRSFTSTSSGTSTSTGPGMPWQSAVGQGLGDVSSYMWARNLMAPQGGGSTGWNFGADPSICWVAAALYGWGDTRMLLARAYLLEREREGGLWRVGVKFYRWSGPVLAPVVRRVPVLRHLARRLFDRIVIQAIND